MLFKVLCLNNFLSFKDIQIRKYRQVKGKMAYGLWLMAYGLWLMAYGLWLMAYGLWLMAYGLWLMAYGLWLMAYAKVLNLHIITFCSLTIIFGIAHLQSHSPKGNGPHILTLII
ncbi:hypothetical protein [Chryseobacterium pennipullorum]|uniref:Uncharacterized protein n=1 Tax=Chryseobacterium pennipullorum TaxID=2258963 RepID=A0A3D9BAB0_9FLAO|nr:hypothetical protein [Chryseobacterium pennipullorum]REC50298.1 hypothetical protein DRF67_01865 [Chryseobacterium pennipullorum]